MFEQQQHQVHVFDVHGNEIIRLQTDKGPRVGQIVSDICRQMAIPLETVTKVEVLVNDGKLRIRLPMDSEVGSQLAAIEVVLGGVPNLASEKAFSLPSSTVNISRPSTELEIIVYGNNHQNNSTSPNSDNLCSNLRKRKSAVSPDDGLSSVKRLLQQWTDTEDAHLIDMKPFINSPMDLSKLNNNVNEPSSSTASSPDPVMVMDSSGLLLHPKLVEMSLEGMLGGSSTGDIILAALRQQRLLGKRQQIDLGRAACEPLMMFCQKKFYPTRQEERAFMTHLLQPYPFVNVEDFVGIKRGVFGSLAGFMAQIRAKYVRPESRNAPRKAAALHPELLDLKLEEMLSTTSEGKRIFTSLQEGAPMSLIELRRISEHIFLPIMKHCERLNHPSRQELRQYVGHLFSEFPQIQTEDLVSGGEPSRRPLEVSVSNEQCKIKRRRTVGDV